MRTIRGRSAARVRLLGRRAASVASALVVSALLLSACGSAATGGSSSGGSGKDSTVNIVLTPAGCTPKPATVPAGNITVNVSNKDADAVSEAELRTSDLSHILGEQENLTPGLSGGFSLNIDPGRYVVNCPGAGKQHWTFTVTGKSAGSDWKQNTDLVSAVNQYSAYVDQNVSELVTSTQAMCTAINSGSLSASELAYPKARVYYERIEPVAEIWGALDTDIDGRWQNPVTVPSQFIGFHKIEQIMWEKDALAGAPKLCAGLVKNEKQLLALVKAATYNPLEMAAGSADLINEAATAKVTGEEERYSNTDLVVLQANVNGAEEIVNLLRPYLAAKDPKLLKELEERDAAATSVLNRFKAEPGYDGTGYVEYSTVLDPGREQLSKALDAYEKSLEKLSDAVSS
jgi:iron uptake system component EfeO